MEEGSGLIFFWCLYCGVVFAPKNKTQTLHVEPAGSKLICTKESVNRTFAGTKCGTHSANGYNSFKKFTNTYFTFRIALRFLFRRQAFSEGLHLPQKQNRITNNHTPEPPTANNNHHRNHGRP
jgi:hypothetical protein